ncbi:MAG TPA: hypothetical protein VK467_05210 [Gemmatimonadales bacterium]|nr:hypothetical protein [Gemmatimonadales bacterium]
MHKVIGGVVLAAALLPGVAASQHEDAKHEFGIDAAFIYRKPSGLPGRWVSGAPADVRIGFVSKRRIMLEVGFQYGVSGGGGTSAHDFSVGVEAQWAKNHRRGLYLAVGPAVEFAGQSGSPSGTLFSVGGDIGTRIPYGSGAFRLSTGVRYSPANTSYGTVNSFNVHARVGLSLWH